MSDAFVEVKPKQTHKNRNPPNNPFVYSRDYLLSLFATDYPLPEDLDVTLTSYVLEPRPPLAHLPLSDTEKKLFQLLSINSESNRRPNFVGTPKQPRQVGAVRDAKPRNKDKERNNPELWDMPAEAGGSFGADGVFGFNNLAIKKTDNAILQTKNNWSILDNEVEGSARPSPPNKVNPLDDPFKAAQFLSNSGGRDVMDMPFGFGNQSKQPAFNPMFGAPQQGFAPQVQQFGFPSSAPFPSLTNTAAPPFPTGQVPPFQFNPPQWNYQDPQGRVQGSYTSQQMHDWYIAGFFPANLPIQCVGDTDFIPLLQFVEKYGGDEPFLVSLREQEALERAYYMRQVQIHFSMGQRNDTSIANTDFGGSSFGYSSPSPFSANPFAPRFTTENQTEEQSSNPVVKDGSPKSSVPSPTKSPMQKSPVPAEVKPPTKENSPVMKSNVIEPKKMDPSPAPTQEDPKPPVNATKKDKKKNKKVAPPEPVVDDSEAQVVEPPAPVPEIVVKPAWGAVNVEKKKEKIPLKDIQASEQKEQETREKINSKVAEKSILAEAQSLAKQEAAVKSSPIPSAQWATAAAPKPTKKTLAEIMADEAKQKQQSEQVKATEVKGYAKSVMSGAGASAVPMSFARVAASKAPVVVATGPVLKASAPSPVIVDGADGWKVVGKSPTVITSGKSPSVSATANRPGRLNYAGATGNTTGSPSNANGEAPTPLTKSNGASAQMLKWCRDTLKPVSKETSLNVDEFISILMSVDIKESSTITMICDHSIGGFTAIDSRKFADEFIQKRRAELSGQSPWTPTNEPAKKQPVAAASTDDDAGWTAVGGHGKAPQLSTNPITTFASDNKFTAVVGKGQSGNKKKKNKK